VTYTSHLILLEKLYLGRSEEMDMWPELERQEMYREFSWGNSLQNIHLAAGRKQKENSAIHFGDTEREGRSW